MHINLLVLTGLLGLAITAPAPLQERGACNSACQQEWQSVQNCNNGGKCRGGTDFKKSSICKVIYSSFDNLANIRVQDSCCDYHSKVKRANENPKPKAIVPVSTNIISPWPVHTESPNPPNYLLPKPHVPVASAPVSTALEKRKDPCAPACQKQWDTLQDCRAHTTCGGGWLDAEFKAAYVSSTISS
jgi:hypothetical protein